LGKYKFYYSIYQPECGRTRGLVSKSLLEIRWSFKL
jgi:hypothetical protein